LRGGIAVQIQPGVVLYDEDSEMFGTGRIDVTADSTGIHASGLYAIEGGYYVQYREEMRVAGGVFSFSGHSFEPRVTVRSVHVAKEPLGTGLGTGLRPMDHFPPIESFAIGMPPVVSEEARRLSLLPESKTELGATLLYGVDPEVVTGERGTPFWRPDDGEGLVGQRAKTQSTSLLWGYFANELYDFLPPSRAHLTGGVISVGSEYPGRMIAGPYIGGAIQAGRFQATLTQPITGDAAPGLRLRYRLGAWHVAVFDEPLFRSAVTEGGSRGFSVTRRTGLGLRWGKDY
jgi:hypothetical protein